MNVGHDPTFARTVCLWRNTVALCAVAMAMDGVASRITLRSGRHRRGYDNNAVGNIDDDDGGAA
jgi:hypothetical protein